MKSLTESAGEWLLKRPFLCDIAKPHLAIYEVLDRLENKQVDISKLDLARVSFLNGTPLLEVEELNVFDAEYIDKVFAELSSLPIFKDGKSFEKYLMQIAFAKSLSGSLADIMAWQEANKWDKPYCPTCGSKPNMAELRKSKRGRGRFLSCPNCRTTWSYKRIGCPYCDNVEQEKLSIIDVAEEPDIRIDVCDSCKSYLKTYVGEGNRDIALDDWASTHLDILCKDTQYVKQGNILRME